MQFWTVDGHIYAQPSPATLALDTHIAELLVVRLNDVTKSIDKGALALDLARRDWQTVLDTIETKHFLDPNNRAVSKTTVLGLLAVAEATAADCDAFVARIQALLGAPAADRASVAAYLRGKAVETRLVYDQLQQAMDDVAMYGQYESPGSPEQAALRPADWEVRLADARSREARLRQEYYDRLTAEPLLGLTRNGQMQWAALAAAPADQPVVLSSVMGGFLQAGIEDYSAKATEFRGMRSLGDLWQFAGLAYAPIRLQVTRLGQEKGSELLPYLMGEVGSVGAAIDAHDAADKVEVATGLAIVAAGASLTVLAPVVSVAASAQQVTSDAMSLDEATDRLEAARTIGPLVGYDTLTTLEKRQEQQTDALFTSVLFGVFDVGDAGLRVARGIQAYRTAKALERAVEGVGTAVTDASAVLKRLDADVVGRAQDALTEGFIADQKLKPVVRVEGGGQVFYLSEPFEGPGKRLFLYAYEELENGQVAVRVFYRSNEHGVIRVMPNGGPFGGGVSKGAMAFKDPEFGTVLKDIDLSKPAKQGYANQLAVDVTNELQLPVGRWLSGRPARVITDPVALNHAFFGAVPATLEGSDLHTVLTLENELHAAPPGFMDFSAPPTLVERGWDHSPLYGWHEKFRYRSADGTVEYLVMRDSAGNVWVPSAQAVEAGTFGGIKRWSFDTHGQVEYEVRARGGRPADARTAKTRDADDGHTRAVSRRLRRGPQLPDAACSTVRVNRSATDAVRPGDISRQSPAAAAAGAECRRQPARPESRPAGGVGRADD